MTEITATPQDLASVLKEQTSEHHRRAEQRPFQQILVTGSVTAEEYAAWLEQMLHVHEALEDGYPELAGAGGERLTALAEPKAPLLREDLARWRKGDTHSAPLPSVARFVGWLSTLRTARPYSLVGPLYVLEGSSNGNRFIARRLSKVLGTPVHRYLDPYGEGQRERWSAFREALQSLQPSAEEREAVVEAAARTFDVAADIGDEILARLRPA